MSLKKMFRNKYINRILACILSGLLFFCTYVISFTGKNSAYASTLISRKSEYSNATDMYKAMMDLNKEMSEEGFVLLKNDNKCLPMTKKAGSKLKVSLFGKNASQYAYFGFGSSDNGLVGAPPSGIVPWRDINVSVYQAFQQSETFDINPTLVNFYNDANKSGQIRLNGDTHRNIDDMRAGIDVGETPIEKYTSVEKNSFKDYNDAAIVMLTRVGAEGSDVSKTSLKSWSGYNDSNKLDSARAWDDHYLQLDKNEVNMLQMVMNNFDNVIVLLNTNSQMEVGFLDDPNHYLYSDNNYATTENAKVEAMNKIKAAMYIGFPGTNGALAIPSVLDGSANPSGHLADTWMRDFKKDPTWQNQGMGGNPDNIRHGDYFVHYEEDIYLGYRYYETRYITEGEKGNDRDAWYKNNVVYPFGYGMSYTKFDWTVDSILSSTGNKTLAKNGEITAQVTVRNSGTVAGKEVVQLYYNTPYYAEGISKAHVVLGAFAKTKLLQPAEEETLTLKLKVSEMYSYDWSDANVNGKKCYELDEGDYKITIAKDAHEAAKLLEGKTETFTISKGYIYDKDTKTGSDVGNLFDNVSGKGKVNDRKDFKGVGIYMSRDDFEGTFPTPSQEKKNGPLQGKQRYTISEEYDKGKPWHSDEKFEQPVKPGTAETNKIKLWHLTGRDYNDPLWEKLLDQLTAEEMAQLIGNCVYYTVAIPSIDKPYTKENDGPLGNRFCISIQWQSAPISAQTFNTELTYRQGRLMGNGCYYPAGNNKTGGTYGPGLETHRSPFGGRNMEYYSEDPLLGGNMCAPFMQGAWEMGSYQLIKHFVLNNCETERNSISTWASEQAIREVYAKAYEIVVKGGYCQGFMSAVSYIGDMPCTTSWELLTGLLRNEWGFQGMVISDMLTQDVELSIRSGNDLMLTGNGMNAPRTSAQYLTTTQLYNIRKSAKNILHVMSNSLVMDGFGGDALDNLEYGGTSKLYAVKDVDNPISINTATYKTAGYNDIKYELRSGSVLPSGMTMNSDGTISGSPTETGSFSFTVVASEKASSKVAYSYAPVTKSYNMTIYDKNNLPEQIIYEDSDLGVVPYGFEYSKNIASAVYFNEEGSTINSGITYKLKEGNKLPLGLTLKDGIISGKTYEEPGTFFFTIIAEHPDKVSKSLDMIVNIKAYNMEYPVKELDDLELGKKVVISVGDATSSDNLEITYKLKNGSFLPQGLELTKKGEIVGTPTKAYNDKKFTVVASAKSTKDKEVTYSLTVKGLVFDDLKYENLLVNKAYKFNVKAEANNGVESEVYYEVKNLANNNLPTGFNLLANGTLIGVAQDIGEMSFMVSAKAEGQVVAEATVTMSMYDIYEEEPDGVDGQPIVENKESKGCNSASQAFVVVLSLGAFIALRRKV